MDSGVFYMAVLLLTLLLKLPGGAEIPSPKERLLPTGSLPFCIGVLQTLVAGFLIGDSSLSQGTHSTWNRTSDSPPPVPVGLGQEWGGGDG